jgi:hypothetical protein
MPSDDRGVQFGRDRLIDLEETSPAFIVGRLLLRTTRDDTFVIDTPLQQLVVATFERSQDTDAGRDACKVALRRLRSRPLACAQRR